MSTFVERRRTHLKDLLTVDVTQAELEEAKSLLRQLATRNNDHCQLLNLPPEIRNQVYRYIADNAHAKYVNYLPVGVDSMYSTNLMKDVSGAKARPGLFLTCRRLHDEFHRIFYSDLYIDAQALLDNGEWQVIRSSAFLDAIVNKKHNIFLSPCARSKQICYQHLARKNTPYDLTGLIRLSDEVYVEWSIFVHKAPFCEVGQTFDKTKAVHLRDCRTFTARSFDYVRKEQLCSICILSGQGTAAGNAEKRLSRY